MPVVEQAERAVLCALFRRYPKAFVWIGGSVLQLLYGSPRTSYDLDLAPQDELPPARDLAAVLRAALERLSEILSRRYAVDLGEASRPDMLRLSVTEAGVRIFFVDFTRISGHVRETRAAVIDSPLGPQAVVTPTSSYLFLMKLEALLFRRFLKVTDVFDLWFLRSRGVRLDKQQRHHLSDEVAIREIDFASVEARLHKLTPERFLAELKRRLSNEEFHSWNARRARAAIDTVRGILRREIRWR